MMLKPWLWISSDLAHTLAPIGLKAYGSFRSQTVHSWHPVEKFGLKFANPLGLAAGIDKNAEQIEDWWTTGVGFLEIGTVVPLPQEPNPGHIMDRDTRQRAVWNKMGFPSKGVEHVVTQLKRLKRPYFTPLFLNIGKNRYTPNDRAHEDYSYCLKKLAPFADGFVINISSPNTQGLRELLTDTYLEDFLGRILETRDVALASLDSSTQKQIPVLLKISPDLTDDQLEFCLNKSFELGIDGWVLTNTTLERNGVHFPKEGGVSGAPLRTLSKRTLQNACKILGPKKNEKMLISVGGIMAAHDVSERLTMGADLVQAYSALVFEGPGFFKTVARSLARPS